MKLLDPFKRSLVRYFGRPAPSVSPQKPPEAVETIPAFLETKPEHRVRLMARTVDISTAGKTPEEVNAEVHRVISELMRGAPAPGAAAAGPDLNQYHGTTHAALREHSPTPPEHGTPKRGVRNLITGEMMPHPDDLRWNDILEMRAHLVVPGWTFCRFPLRNANDPGAVVWVFGAVRGFFGAIWEPFFASDVGAVQPLGVLMHLPSGTALGVMTDVATCCEAADAVSKLAGIDWTAINPGEPATFQDFRPRINEVWHGIGIGRMEWHAHALNGTEITDTCVMVFGREETEIVPNRRTMQ